MGEIDRLIGDEDFSEVEIPGKRQELLNSVYSNFLDLPIQVLKRNADDNPTAVGFSHRFKEGTTTPGFSDHISGRFDLAANTLTIFYAKGIHAGKIVLKDNPGDENVNLESFQVLRKESHIKGKKVHEVYLPALTFDGRPSSRPHLHAIESLVIDAKKICESNIRICKDELLEEKSQAFAWKEVLRIKARIRKMEAKSKRNRK